MFAVPEGPSEAKIPITVRRIHLIRRPYAKRRGRRETMFDCPLSKTVKILDQRSCILISRQIFGAGGAIIQKKNKEKEKGKGKEERREKRKKERGEFNLEDPMFLLISILSSKKL